MNRPEIFDRNVDKLVKAFFKGTLAKGKCDACAVGNICDNDPAWGQGFSTQGFYQNQGDYIFSVTLNQRTNWLAIFNSDFRAAIKKSGLKRKELMQIEYAFEEATAIPFSFYEHCSQEQIMEDQFNGLMAVVDVMMDIHNIDKKQEQIIKSRFDYKMEQDRAVPVLN